MGSEMCIRDSPHCLQVTHSRTKHSTEQGQNIAPAALLRMNEGPPPAPRVRPKRPHGKFPKLRRHLVGNPRPLRTTPLTEAYPRRTTAGAAPGQQQLENHTQTVAHFAPPRHSRPKPQNGGHRQATTPGRSGRLDATGVREPRAKTRCYHCYWEADAWSARRSRTWWSSSRRPQRRGP